MKKTKRHSTESLLDEAGSESFPASDPLAWNLGAATNIAQNQNKIAISLANEHNIIKKVMLALLTLIQVLETNQSIDNKLIQELSDFFQHFVDESHHQKESLLYQTLNKKKLKASSYLIKDLLHEHAFGNELLSRLQGLSHSLPTTNHAIIEKMIRLLKDIHHLYSTHIEKEEEYILPHLNTLVDKKTQETLLLQFEKINKSINIKKYKHLLELNKETV